MNKMYGFEGEVKSKYNSKMAELFTEIFNYLPLCHVINNKVFVILHFYSAQIDLKLLRFVTVVCSRRTELRLPKLARLIEYDSHLKKE